MLWHVGDATGAVEAAESAVGLLESVPPPGAELARAYAGLARLQSLTERSATLARANAELGVSLAERLGEEAVAVSALTTIAVLDIYSGRETGWRNLERVLERARAAGLDEELGRALVNLVEAGGDLRRYDIADRYRDEALAQVNERGVDRIFLQRRLLSDHAELDLERGRWDDAERLALELLAKQRVGAVARVRALAVVGRLRARRGEAGAWELLDEALALGVSERGLLAAARAEIAWLAGNVSLSRREAEGGLAAAADWEEEDRWWRGELVFWLWKAGGGSDLVQKAAEPYALHIVRRYREAAAIWRSIGAPYKEALALAECEDERSLRQALAIFNKLGARPMARHVAGSLQKSGARRIPRGPRASTARNPAGLTPREFEVLTLLDSGIRNIDIAERLVVSPKTVEHHVSAILRKLGVANRDAAAAEAARLGLQDGGRATAR
jgi:DNA-binding CsgD family transcriptional regulator